MGSESDCLFGHNSWTAVLDSILWTSDSEAGVKTEKSGGVAGEHGECGDDVVRLLVRDRRSLDILPVKKKRQSCLQVKCQVPKLRLYVLVHTSCPCPVTFIFFYL